MKLEGGFVGITTVAKPLQCLDEVSVIRAPARHRRRPALTLRNGPLFVPQVPPSRRLGAQEWHWGRRRSRSFCPLPRGFVQVAQCHSRSSMQVADLACDTLQRLLAFQIAGPKSISRSSFGSAQASQIPQCSRHSCASAVSLRCAHIAIISFRPANPYGECPRSPAQPARRQRPVLRSR